MTLGQPNIRQQPDHVEDPSGYIGRRGSELEAHSASQPLAAHKSHLHLSPHKSLHLTMSGRGKGGKVRLRLFLLFFAALTCSSGSRKGRRKASPQDPARQHPGHHETCHPSSRSSRRCEAYLGSDLRRDPRCSQDLFGKCSYPLLLLP